jgi:hypothetical protein
MMIERGISTKELFQVSAYIDGALSPKEQRTFEAHLASSATLQEELLEYKRLKAALRSLPQKTAPRNFTLSPEKVQVRKAVPRLAPVFSFASAGVAILLMLAFGSEYLLGRNAQMVSKEAPAPLSAMLESAPAVDATEPTIIFWNAVPMGSGGGGAEGIGGLGGGGAMLGTAEDVPMIVSVPAEDRSISDAPSSTMVEGVEERETFILGLQTVETSDGSTRLGTWFQMVVDRMAAWTVIRWVEVGLGALLLGFGITTIVFWTKKRR